MVSLPLHAVEAAAMDFSGKSIVAVIGMAAVAIVASRGTDEIFRWFEEDDRPWAAIPDHEIVPTLANMSDQMNASLPLEIDQHTSLVSSSAGPNREFTYNYSLPNHSAGDLDLAAFGQLVSEDLLEHACSDEGALRFLQGNININYLYFDKDGRELSRLTVLPTDCR
jgi:hypothetical protein